MSTINIATRPRDSELELVSEAILAILVRDPERPHYTERAIDRKIENDRRREPVFSAMSRFGDEWLMRRECEDLFRIAGLTERQETVFRLRLTGATFEEIGREGGKTKQGAQRVFVQALAKITRAYRSYPYVGLSEVYRNETRRGSHARRSGTLSR